jgi:hypothetical protein
LATLRKSKASIISLQNMLCQWGHFASLYIYFWGQESYGHLLLFPLKFEKRTLKESVLFIIDLEN